MTWRVDRSEAFGGRSFATTRLRIPWSPEDGLFVFDQFGGAVPIEVPLPGSLVARGMFPYVILSCHDTDSAFLAQRWFDRPIASWLLHGHLGVDSATVCLTPRSIAESARARSGLEAAAQLVREAPDLWAQVALDGRPLLGVRVTVGDGKYPLHIALDPSGEPLGWVLELGVASTT